jgi:hypothetical protein
MTTKVEPEYPPSSVGSRMLNILVTPGDVFDQVIAMPFRQSTWIAPTLVVCLAGLFLVAVGTTQQQTSTAVQFLVEAQTPVTHNAEALNRNWIPASLVIVCAAVLIGTLWSTAVIWAIGRFLLRARFPFSKTLSVVALTGTILALGSLVTGLLVLASGDGAMRPGLSVFLPRLGQESAVITAIGVFNVFHFWSITVLGIGLARLARVSLKESLFWVFGWWLVLRIGLILLA